MNGGARIPRGAPRWLRPLMHAFGPPACSCYATMVFPPISRGRCVRVAGSSSRCYPSRRPGTRSGGPMTTDGEASGAIRSNSWKASKVRQTCMRPCTWGPTHRSGDAEFDSLYYPANRWPSEVPELKAIATRYTDHMGRLAREVLTVLATILEIPDDFFTSRCGRATWTQNINWYPSLNTVGAVQEGQMRVGPHSDFGTSQSAGPPARGRRTGSVELPNRMGRRAV